jgi:hypothetical protein
MVQPSHWLVYAERSLVGDFITRNEQPLLHNP